MRNRDYFIGLVLIFLSTFAWSVTGFFTRLIAMDSLTVIAWRGIFGSASLVLVAVLLRGRRNWMAEFWGFGKAEWLYVANAMFGTVTLITSYAYTSVAHCAVIYATIPFIAALMGWIVLREVPSLRALICSVIALIGVGLMVAVGTDGALLGDLLALCMTVSTGISIVMIRKNTGLRAIGASAVGVFLTSLICFPFAGTLVPEPSQILLLAAFGVINSALGLALFALGSRRLPAVEVGLVSAVDTPLAMAWVWLAFGEQPGMMTLIGGGIVMFAVILHVVIEGWSKRSTSAEPETAARSVS